MNAKDSTLASEVLLLALATSVAPAQAANVPPPPTDCVPAIGTASMSDDGTIALDLRARGVGGVLGDARPRYAPGDPDHLTIRAHIGPLGAGTPPLVRPFGNGLADKPLCREPARRPGAVSVCRDPRSRS